MSEIDRLVGKSLVDKIGEVPITLVPLTLEDFDVIVRASSDKEEVRIQGLTDLVKRTLEKSYPKEKGTVAKISMKYMNDLVPLVLKVNGLATDKDIEAMKGSPLEGEDQPQEKGTN